MPLGTIATHYISDPSHGYSIINSTPSRHNRFPSHCSIAIPFYFNPVPSSQSRPIAIPSHRNPVPSQSRSIAIPFHNITVPPQPRIRSHRNHISSLSLATSIPIPSHATSIPSVPAPRNKRRKQNHPTPTLSLPAPPIFYSHPSCHIPVKNPPLLEPSQGVLSAHHHERSIASSLLRESRIISWLGGRSSKSITLGCFRIVLERRY
jgi:hypothetical protein